MPSPAVIHDGHSNFMVRNQAHTRLHIDPAELAPPPQHAPDDAHPQLKPRHHAQPSTSAPHNPDPIPPPP
ncbi:hypothetical protein, partial [Nocardia pseudovaccinii]|uniref:hypothetical protein n=1 Tax=Nocardia pseudovaccinii TaxID=189540 RepID=UPI0035A25963